IDEFRHAGTTGAPRAVELHTAIAFERLEDFGAAKDHYRRYLKTAGDLENEGAIRAHIAWLDVRAADVEARAEAAEHDEWLGPRRLVGLGVSGGAGYRPIDSSSNRVLPGFPSPAADVF